MWAPKYVPQTHVVELRATMWLTPDPSQLSGKHTNHVVGGKAKAVLGSAELV
jgi:hypothetical protein